VRRLSPGDHPIGDAAAEITVQHGVAAKVLVAAVRTQLASPATRLDRVSTNHRRGCEGGSLDAWRIPCANISGKSAVVIHGKTRTDFGS
jgi:hypothetical protein